MDYELLSDNLKFLLVHQASDLYGSSRVFIRSVRALRIKWPEAHITVQLPQEGAIVPHLKHYADEIKLGDVIVLRRQNLHLKNFWEIVPAFMNMVQVWNEMRRYDFVYINTIVLPCHILMSRFTFTKCLIHCHETPTGFEAKIFSLILNLAAGKLVFVSNACRKAFFLAPWRTYHILRNGTPEPNKQIELEKNNKIHFLLMGRFNALKGQDLLLEALAKLKQQTLQKIAVRLVGDVFENQTQFKDRIFDLIEKYQLNDVVKVFAFVEDPECHYQWAHIVLVPSTKPESCPLVVIEAMAHGRPTLVARHGGVVEMCIDQQTGLHFKAGDALDLATQITKYADNWHLIQAHGKAARQRYKNIFQEQHYLDNLTHIVEKMWVP